MPEISVLLPTAQPTGRQRLLAEVQRWLRAPGINRLSVVAAYAKLAPVLKLKDDIRAFRRRGQFKAIFGIDQHGTSLEALQFGLDEWDEVRICYVPQGLAPTFHPKVYLAEGPNRGVAFIGSNNFTVGGLELNLECGVFVDTALPAEERLYSGFRAIWTDASNASAVLDRPLLQQLIAEGLVLPEQTMRRAAAGANGTGGQQRHARLPAFPPLVTLPPMPLPAGAMRGVQPQGVRERAAAAPGAAAPGAVVAQALVMQIVPHHNGEIFLSKTAVDQNHAFFGWPFLARTVPKRPGNPAYPQREPDPVVNVRVIDAHGALVAQLGGYNLNTVYYETNHEIRITITHDVVALIPEMSILLMRHANQPGLDYEMDIFAPGSAEYNRYLAACNQRMPSGGRPDPRSFGWL